MFQKPCKVKCMAPNMGPKALYGNSRDPQGLRVAGPY